MNDVQSGKAEEAAEVQPNQPIANMMILNVEI